MKNIHILPTDKPSRIYLIKSNNKLGITSNNPEFTENFGSGTQNQHIYITNLEEIKVGDWYYLPKENKVAKCPKIVKLSSVTPEWTRKIILTTDQDLIKDGVQEIDDEFLEWFVKNPSCEEVQVEQSEFYSKKDFIDDKTAITYSYKIIIPKEESKCECGSNISCKCEPEVKDLEYWKQNAEEDYITTPISVLRYITELEKKRYSKEEVKEQLNLILAMKNSLLDTFTDDKSFITDEWFEQF